MPHEPQMDPNSQIPRRRGRNLLFAALAGALVLLGALLLLIVPRQAVKKPVASAESVMPFGAAEQAFAAKIKVDNLSLSRAENFLHQEVTTLSGEVTNSAGSPLFGLALTIEFSNDLSQVVLRETRRAIDPVGPPLKPGETRSFEIAFDHVSADWNNQPPRIRITGLLVSAQK